MPIVTQQNTLFCIQSWHKPTKIRFYYRTVFSVDKPETVHSVKYFYTLCGLMKFKLFLPLDATILFWRSYTCHTCSWINAAKLAQIVASLIEGREHKSKWDKLLFTAWFMSLAFLMLSCNITKKRQKPASDTAPTVNENVGSPFPTQFERVNWLNLRCTHVMIHHYMYTFIRY